MPLTLEWVKDLQFVAGDDKGHGIVVESRKDGVSAGFTPMQLILLAAAGCMAMDVVSKTGAWFTFGETRLGQGREAAKSFLRDNAPVAAEIESRIRSGCAGSSFFTCGKKAAQVSQAGSKNSTMCRMSSTTSKFQTKPSPPSKPRNSFDFGSL